MQIIRAKSNFTNDNQEQGKTEKNESPRKCVGRSLLLFHHGRSSFPNIGAALELLRPFKS
jgi:hypothetical protein